MTSSSRKKLVIKRKHTSDYSAVFQHMKSRGYDLYPYQKEGVRWMLDRERVGTPIPTFEKNIKGGLLCDEPGLGKTIQTCACMYGNYMEKTLIIVPGAVMHQWKEAIQNILPECTIYTHHGANRCITVEDLHRKEFNIVLTTLGMIYGDKKNPRTILHSFGCWDRIIIDEIHYLRNARSKKSLMACELIGQIKWGITGTPVQNSEKDIYTLYTYLGIPKKYQNISCVEVLNKTLLKRRTKSMVEHYNDSLKMPLLNQIDHALEFSTDGERRLYYKIQQNVTKEYLDLMNNDDLPDSNIMVILFELLLRLRQASIHPQIVINGFKRKFKKKFKNYDKNTTKIDKIVEIINNTPSGDNCLVFCHFRDEMLLVQEALSKMDIKSEQYHGSQSHSEKLKVLGKFPSNDINPPKVLLIQINAGGVGLNLQQFNHVFINSPNWNPSNEIQAIARAHRIGQDKPVDVHRFILYDQKGEFSTIDERICGIQQEKRNIMANILNDRTYLDTGEINLSGIKSESLLNKLNMKDIGSLLV